MSLTLIPEDYFFRHVKGSVPNLNLLAQVDFTGPWYMLNDPSMLYILDGRHAAEIKGHGTQTFPIQLTNEVNNYDAGFYDTKIQVFSADGTQNKTLTLHLMVSKTADEIVMPHSLHFDAVRNVRNAQAQKIYVASSDASLIFVLPPFLEMVEHELLGSGHIYELKPIAQNQTPNRKYQGVVEIKSQTSTLRRIPVTYDIKGGYDPTFSKPVYFSADRDELLFYRTTTENSFLKLHIDLRSFTYSGKPHRSMVLDWDFPFIEDVAKISLGKEIEPYFQQDPPFGLSYFPKSVYPPMELRITAVEIRYEDFAILNQDILPLLYFLKGRNPLISKSIQPFWATKRPGYLRLVSNKALLALSLFKPGKVPVQDIEMRINNKFVKLLAPRTNDFGILRPCFSTCIVNLSDFPLKAGDELTFSNYDSIIRYVIRPQPSSSILIAFLSKFNIYDIIEFTGNIRFATSYTHELEDYKEVHSEITRKVSSKSAQKLIVNTGWIQKEEMFRLDELIMSAKAILLPPTIQDSLEKTIHIERYEAEQEQIIDIVPVAPKLLDFDSDSQSYQFDVEFVINPNYENKIYSR